MSPNEFPIDPRFAHLPPPPTNVRGVWWTMPVPPIGAPTGVPLPPPQVPPPAATPVPSRDVEVDVRNLVLGLGVACLVAAAVSFVAVNWDSFDASMRASLLLGTTVASLLLGGLARSRRLTGTATALSWLTTVLAFVDLAAVQRAAFADADALAVTAVGGGVLVVGFLALGRWQPGAAATTGAVTAWMLGWWSAFGHWDVTGPDVWLLPLAALVGLAQWHWSNNDTTVGSWGRYGIALTGVAAIAVTTALGDPGVIRPMIVVAGATLVLLAGLRLRHLAPVWVGGASLGVLVGAQLVDVVREFPGWSIFALVGVALLGVGAAFELRLRREQQTDPGSDQPVRSGSAFT